MQGIRKRWLALTAALALIAGGSASAQDTKKPAKRVPRAGIHTRFCFNTD